MTEFHSPLGGGVRTYLDAKAKWLSGRPEIKHVIVVPSREDGLGTHFNSAVYRVAGPPAPASPGYHVLLRPRKLRAILERERPDVIEMGSIYAVPWLLRYATGRVRARTVGYFHMDLVSAASRVLPERWPDFLWRAARATLAAYLRAAYGRCECVVAPSPSAERALREAGLPHTAVVPLGVDTQQFHPRWLDPSWRREVGAADGQPVGLYVGRLAGEKDVHTLMEALPRLHQALQLKLVMIGEGSLRPALERVAETHPRMLTLLPYEADRDRLARAYATADLYFAVCSHETFGLAAVEAAASGLPVVGVASGAVGDLLQGGDWGRTYRAGDIDGVVTAAEELLARDRDVTRAAARRAAQAYEWDATFDRLLEVYRELVPIPSH